MGECCVIHLPEKFWIIVDSCIDNQSGRPSALAYLSQLGVDPGLVRWVVATHWHDDHISGLAETLKVCSNARFCCSSALTTKEFIAVVKPFEQSVTSPIGSGVNELIQVLKELKTSGRSPYKRAGADVTIDQFEVSLLDQHFHGRIETLSPADMRVDNFLLQISALMPSVGQTRTRLPNQQENDLSVVLLIVFGEVGILLGADLEISSNPALGWHPIITSSGRSQTRSVIFKVPHHGSENGHWPAVWDQMLTQDPIAVATPYNRGRKPLPSSEDITRICGVAGSFYITSQSARGPARRRSAAIDKTIRELSGNLNKAEATTGLVRLRKKSRVDAIWSRELFGRAYDASL